MVILPSTCLSQVTVNVNLFQDCALHCALQFTLCITLCFTVYTVLYSCKAHFIGCNGLERTVLPLSIFLAFRQYERPACITVVKRALQL